MAGLTRHLGLKIVSVTLAFLLWLAVAGQQIVERSFRIPLEFTNLPAQFEVVGDPPEMVDVRVKGSSALLSRVGTADLSAVIDLRGGRAGRRLFPLTDAQVRSPFGLEVVQVTPSTVAITLEPSSSKVVPIRPTASGEPAAGFVVGTMRVEPATVELVGPMSVLEHVTEAVTEPVQVDGASVAVTEEVTVGSPDGAVRLRAPLRARVSVAVERAPVEWAVAEVPVRVKGGAEGIVPVPAIVTLHLRGPAASVTTRLTDFEATVDVTGLAAGELLVPVHVVAPDRVGVINVEPPEVRVRVK